MDTKLQTRRKTIRKPFALKTALTAAAVAAALAAGLYGCSPKSEKTDAGAKQGGSAAIPANAKVIAASFYPIYIAAKNVVDGIGGLHLARLAPTHTGCMHNYQLTTSDAAILERAAAFIINGGGMEPFLERAVQLNRDLIIIDASSDIDFIIERTSDRASAVRQSQSRNHDHNHDHNHNHNHDHDHDHNHAVATDSELVQIQNESRGSAEDNFIFAHHREDYPHITNPHVWLSVENHIRQVSAIAWRLSSWDRENAIAYNENAQEYIVRLQALKDSAENTIDADEGCDTVAAVEHNGFAYLMRELGIRVVAVAEKGHGAQASASDLINTINTIRNERVKVMFVEDEDHGAAITAIAEDTGVMLVKLDMITSGDNAADSYITSMAKNIAAIKKAMCRPRDI